MQTRLILAVAAFLAFAPFALAHDPAGTPKTYCEVFDWDVHDYGSGGPGFALAFFMDGNLDDCDGDGVPQDFDGHSEYAQGGAWILACELACGLDGTGAGATACFGEPAHHAYYGPFEVNDVVFGSTPPGIVWVAADYVDVLGVNPCGDFVSQDWAGFVGGCPCYVTFPPGLDGSYWVYISAGQGHVVWSGGSGGGAPPSDPAPPTNSGRAAGHAP